ncbi:hypothetical protein PMZ80_009679 [Knufia obscura]|uniref:BTB domain-containing protein n=1 Tax=Knufia obscura TaxID=1635080 RepID=A0ABR0RCX6_9EURO|nr:hypothetical protein PMZ80_009679 [Knufia obscura]
MTSNIVNVVDRGDVILVVGGDDKILKLRTDSHMRRAASDAFAALFGPDFAEGKHLSYETAKEIPLPDDDPQAMKLICQVIHLKHSLVPDQLESNQLLRVAKLVDKYFLHESMSLAIAKWLHIEDGSHRLNSLGNYLEAATLLGQASAFKKATKALVLNIVEPYDSLINETSSTKLIKTICALERKRNELQNHLSQAIYDNLSYATSNNACGCLTSYMGDLCRMLRNRKLEPADIRKKPLCNVLADFGGLPRPKDTTYRGKCSKWNCDHSLPATQWQRLRDATTISNDLFDGLCLQGI